MMRLQRFWAIAGAAVLMAAPVAFGAVAAAADPTLTSQQAQELEQTQVTATDSATWNNPQITQVPYSPPGTITLTGAPGLYWQIVVGPGGFFAWQGAGPGVICPTYGPDPEPPNVQAPSKVVAQGQIGSSGTVTLPAATVFGTITQLPPYTPTADMVPGQQYNAQDYGCTAWVEWGVAPGQNDLYDRLYWSATAVASPPPAPQPAPQPAPSPAPEPKPATPPQPQPVSQPQPKPQPKPTAQPQPVSQPQPNPTPKPQPKPAIAVKAPAEEKVGQAIPVTVVLTENGRPAAHQTVTLATSAGRLAAAQATTNAQGQATDTLSAAPPGLVTITAHSLGISGAAQVRVVAPPPVHHAKRKAAAHHQAAAPSHPFPWWLVLLLVLAVALLVLVILRRRRHDDGESPPDSET